MSSTQQEIIDQKIVNFANFCDQYAHLSSNPNTVSFCTSTMRNLPHEWVMGWIKSNCKEKTKEVVIDDFLSQFFIRKESVPREGIDKLHRYAQYFIDIANQL